MGSTSKQKSNQSSSGVNSSNSVNSGLGVNYGTSTGGNFGTTSGGSQQLWQQPRPEHVNGQQLKLGRLIWYLSSSQDVWSGQSPFLQEVYNAASAGNADAQAAIQNLSPGIQDQISGLSHGWYKRLQPATCWRQCSRLISAPVRSPECRAIACNSRC